MNIELYAQDSNQELHSSVGIFSLMNNKWLNQPNAEQISIDDAAIQNKTEPYEFEIDSLKEKILTILNREGKSLLALKLLPELLENYSLFLSTGNYERLYKCWRYILCDH